MTENISQLDNDVFEIIWEAGRKKAMRDGDKAFKRTNEQEIESCMRENPNIQKLQDMYQLYLKNPNISNKNVVTSLVNFIKNPTAKNRAAYDLALTRTVNVRA